MRILQISSAKSFGGGEKHLVDLIAGLSARGHEVFLAASEDSPLRERVAEANVKFVPLKIGNALDIFAARKLAKLIDREKIDIVHAHVAKDYVPAALAVRFASRAKLVISRHVLFPMKSLHKLSLSNVSRVIAVSNAVEKQLLSDNIFPAEKIVTIANGIDVAHWADLPHNEARRTFRQSHSISDEELLIGFVGELKKLKGQEDLIMAAEIVLQKFPVAKFILVGRDNSATAEYRRYLHDMAAAIGAADKFIWLDWVDDTAPLLHALDVFVSPSHSESFGLSILEAMSAGCGVVATETEGAKELLGATDLIPVTNPVKLADAICEFLGDETAREKAGQENQVRAMENFTLEKMIAATEKLYLEL